MSSKPKMSEKQMCKCPFCDIPICLEIPLSNQACDMAGKFKIHRVDCIGLYCPLPVMRAKEEIDKLDNSALMELVADDPAAEEDIARWAKRCGHKLLNVHKKEDEYHFLIQKKEGV